MEKETNIPQFELNDFSLELMKKDMETNTAYKDRDYCVKVLEHINTHLDFDKVYPLDPDYKPTMIIYDKMTNLMVEQFAPDEA